MNCSQFEVEVRAEAAQCVVGRFTGVVVQAPPILLPQKTCD